MGKATGGQKKSSADGGFLQHFLGAIAEFSREISRSADAFDLLAKLEEDTNDLEITISQIERCNKVHLKFRQDLFKMKNVHRFSFESLRKLSKFM
jgi:hypothetical protein